MTRARHTTDLPQGEAKVTAVRAMFDTIAPRYDLVNRVMTFRMDVGWRRTTVRELALPPLSIVVDLASGTGDLCHDLERSRLRPIAVDLSLGMLEHATHGHPRLQADGLRLPLPDASVDGAVCGFALRNFLALRPVFDELARITRPGGRIALLDVAQPTNPVLRFGHGLYFGRVVPLIGGLLSDKQAYSYLPQSVAYMPEPAVMLDDIRAAGFANVERRLLSGGISQLVLATRSPR
jgi:demethylmenaquinone methyltransferase/2-methoxy-6-polyprenyl-1,4-benzoquinol methylase